MERECGGWCTEYSEISDLDRHVYGVGERGVQCCEVLGVVITVEGRRKLGGGVPEKLWGGSVDALAVQPLACPKGVLLLWLYSHWPEPDTTQQLCCSISMSFVSKGRDLNLGTKS